MHTNKIADEANAAQTRTPEFFRMPAKGPDPFFGFTRSYYYLLEKAGDIQLVRIRTRGCTRGVTLVPYDKISAFIRSQANGQGAAA